MILGRARRLSGPVLMVLAGLAFTAMVACVKVARVELGPLPVLFWRGLISVPLAALFARGSGFAVGDLRTLAARCGFGFLGMIGFFTAVKGLSIADLSLISRVQPLLVAVGAPVLFGRSERASRATVAALALGVAGCATLLGPSLAVGNLYGLAALFAATCSAAAHLALRRLGQDERPSAVVFWFQLVSFTMTAVLLLALEGPGAAFPRIGLWPALIGTGVFATVGQLLITVAYQRDQAARVAAASSAGPVWGVIVDFVIWGVVPSVAAWFGGGLVVLAGLLVARERTDAPQRQPSRS